MVNMHRLVSPLSIFLMCGEATIVLKNFAKMKIPDIKLLEQKEIDDIPQDGIT